MEEIIWASATQLAETIRARRNTVPLPRHRRRQTHQRFDPHEALLSTSQRRAS